MKKKVGLVTTARVTHATPANVYAHSVWRGFESETTEGCTEQVDIAQQVGEGMSTHISWGTAAAIVILPQGVSSRRTDTLQQKVCSAVATYEVTCCRVLEKNSPCPLKDLHNRRSRNMYGRLRTVLRSQAGGYLAIIRQVRYIALLWQFLFYSCSIQNISTRICPRMLHSMLSDCERCTGWGPLRKNNGHVLLIRILGAETRNFKGMSAW